MLNFIKDNKFLVGLFLIVLISLVIVTSIVTSFMKNNQKIEEVIVEEHHKEKDGTTSGTVHPDYIPEIKDPYAGNKETATVSDFVLGTPKTYKHSTNPGTGAVLYSAAKNSALINTYGGALYLFNLNSESTFIVEKYTSYGNMDTESKYVLYSRYVDPVLKDKSKQTLHILPTKNYQRTKVGDLEAGLTIQNSVYYNGMFFYVASDLVESKIISGVVQADPNVSLDTINKFKALLANHEFKEFKTFKDKLYGYDKKTNTIFELKNNVWVKKIDVPTPYLLNFAISENNIFLNYTDLQNVYYSINGKMKEEFIGGTSPVWVDENNLLLVIKSNLHIYNAKEDTLEPVLQAVNTVFTDYNKIYLQNGTNNTYIRTIDILNK